MFTEPQPLSPWQRDESLKEAGALLARQPSGIRVVSFDFFDTLISRLCAEPGDLFIEVGRQLAARRLFQRPLTPMEFHSVRIAADVAARKKASSRGQFPEIKLADIYAELAPVLTDVAAACELEFDVERQYIFLNPATISMARHAKSLGYKTAIISDTYFTTAQLHQFLRENGAPAGLFDVTLTSCERGKSKWNGQLYHELLKHYDILPFELMHFGDNEHADIHCARQYGIRPVHYYKTNLSLDRQLLTERKFRSSDLHPAGALNALRIHIARRAESDQDAFRDGAFVFGPVLARFADWCVNQFKTANVRTVLALMREGELLGELVRRSAVAAGVELKVVTCYTSRRATARASLSEFSPAGAMELLEGSSTVTLQSILDVLGLGDEVARQFDPKNLNKPLPAGNAVAELLKLLFDNPRVQQLLKAGCTESHILAYDYLKSLTGNDTRVGVLDIGWGGSIQRNLARILRQGGHPVRTIGCYLARTRKSGRLFLQGDEAHAFMEQDWNRSTILPELAISTPVGSTNGYQRDAAGQVQPVLGDYYLSPEEQTTRARIREGILEFQEFWLQVRTQRQLSNETLADFDQQTASIFYRLLEFPTKAEADRLGGLTHDENYFGENLTAPLCDEPASRLLRREGMLAMLQTSRCHWPQGVLARDNPRLINALGLGWQDIPAMGRLGARHGTPIGESGLTDEEASALGTLVNVLSLRQIILACPPVPALEEIFQFLWRQERTVDDQLITQPRLIFAGQTAGYISSQNYLSRCAFVSGDLTDPHTLATIRSKLVPGINAALVIPGDLPENTTNAILNGLTPFLGREGVVLAACGRYVRNSSADTMPAAKVINEWFKTNAHELGFAPWNSPAGLRPQITNWLVLRRTSAQTFWNNQWTFNAADLAQTEDTEDLLLLQP